MFNIIGASTSASTNAGVARYFFANQSGQLTISTATAGATITARYSTFDAFSYEHSASSTNLLTLSLTSQTSYLELTTSVSTTLQFSWNSVPSQDVNLDQVVALGKNQARQITIPEVKGVQNISARYVSVGVNFSGNVDTSCQMTIYQENTVVGSVKHNTVATVLLDNVAQVIRIWSNCSASANVRTRPVYANKGKYVLNISSSTQELVVVRQNLTNIASEVVRVTSNLSNAVTISYCEQSTQVSSSLQACVYQSVSSSTSFTFDVTASQMFITLKANSSSEAEITVSISSLTEIQPGTFALQHSSG